MLVELIWKISKVIVQVCNSKHWKYQLIYPSELQKTFFLFLSNMIIVIERKSFHFLFSITVLNR